MEGLFFFWGWIFDTPHTSCGTSTHKATGLRRGTSLVICLQTCERKKLNKQIYIFVFHLFGLQVTLLDRLCNHSSLDLIFTAVALKYSKVRCLLLKLVGPCFFLLPCIKLTIVYVYTPVSLHSPWGRTGSWTPPCRISLAWSWSRSPSPRCTSPQARCRTSPRSEI